MDVPVDLIDAYTATHFWVTGVSAPFVLRVGQRSAELEALYPEYGVCSAAFLTAWNPGSEPRVETENQAAQVQMVRELEGAGYRSLAGFGEDPTGRWPGEPSILVLGISREDAEQVGRRFGQNAIVWAGEDAVPELAVIGRTT